MFTVQKPESIASCACSLAAFLNGGVVIRSTNLMAEGAVTIRAQAMGQSAARVAAKQHSIFHGQKKPDEP